MSYRSRFRCPPQTNRGGINGTVSDTSGAALPNAAIIATETATNTQYKAVASSAGEFTITNLPLGSYTLTITVPGFATAKFDNISVETGAPYTLPPSSPSLPPARP